ncbi:SecDF P1 head subdomain-containing protein [Myceligenerans pegani]|uniref:SecDF P1 head subdomain domain-containing protein n=1 Tax=Myceligenerans pegani TaxID=2776917 RepID=A0ABR9MVS6_9MICO|nr:hypothetical protein [Myceligenerans sp. TRM 65318]MBE1875492.1 hypothetical protein [Myceligenerans sp. TRM 65318]MBE3017763.1 hypothetical protein [Myceligenerans sp. TRM 65318]
MTRRAMPVIAMCVVASVLSGCGPLDYRVDSSGAPITRVVLEATPAADDDATAAAMGDAVDVLVERLENGEREVDVTVVEGSTVTMDVIGEVGGEDYPLLTRPGDLAFRPVLALDGGGSGAGSSDVPGVADDVVAEFEALDCTDEAGGDVGAGDPDLPLVACDEARTGKYLLGPAEIDGADVSEASSSNTAETADWVINLQFDEGGTAALTEITERLQGEESPRNQFAVTVDGVVVSAPTIPPGTVITAGAAEISGSFTRESAEALAGLLGTDPLPFPFEVQSVSTE